MRRAGKIDANQNAIVHDLRKAGASVWITSGLGTGVDIVVGFRGVNWLMEVKDSNQPPSKRRLTDDEKGFHLGWRGQVTIVETSEQALRIISLTR